jgi:hypothetical protein
MQYKCNFPIKTVCNNIKNKGKNSKDTLYEAASFYHISREH